ncbi:DNA translocase FtsK [Endothiovibrio diazotrophicus]
MAKAAAKEQQPEKVILPERMVRGLREAGLWLIGALAVVLFIALVTYDAGDPCWSHSGLREQAVNSAGIVGAWFADIFFYLFGYMAYLVPIMVGYSALLVYRGFRSVEGFRPAVLAISWFGFILALCSGTALAVLHHPLPPGVLPLNAGGILGDLVAGGLVGVFNFLGATLFLLALFLTGITLFTNLSWLWLMDWTGGVTLRAVAWVREKIAQRRETRAGERARAEREAVFEVAKSKPKREVVIAPPKKKVEESKRVEEERQIELFEPVGAGERPPLTLLDDPPEGSLGYSPQALEAMSRLVEHKLRDFGVEVEVVEVSPGPVITRFELQPAPGVKVSRISNLSKDLSRAMSAISVRVVEVIPGKSVIGLEVPNEERELVTLGEILRSADYDNAKSPLTLALGKDIAGEPVVADLGRMPHLLVAGTTGSGKSVGVNTMLLSMLYKSSANEVRLILIDPKMLELSVYDGIPHLLTPVVTDMKEAASALRWCVGEMERRYRLMAALGVRNIGGYNRKVREAAEKGEPIPDPLYKPEEALDPEAPPPDLTALPYIVVVVDEFADLMMVVGKKVEELIARLAQKARASGIHLILATQRPSVDVITGLIKANIPTRMAFQVSSKIDSRTILDQMGAETLLGHGDMLYLPPGTGIPQRVHGAFVDDHEVHKIVEFLKRAGEPQYLEEVLRDVEVEGGGGDGATGEGGDAESDPLYDQAVQIVCETRRASVSGVQRRLKIGYNRAARLVEAMELAGVVSPVASNGSREVLAPPPVGD